MSTQSQRRAYTPHQQFTNDFAADLANNANKTERHDAQALKDQINFDSKVPASTSLMYSTGEDCAPILAEEWNKRALLTSDFSEDVRKFSHHMDDMGQGITERQVYDLATELRGILERYRCLR